MADAQRLDFFADRTPADNSLFWVQPFVFLIEDLSAATNFRLQMRDYPDQGGAARIALAKVATDIEGIRLAYSGTDTVANHVAAGRLDNGIYGQTNPTTRLPFQPADNLLLSYLIAKALIDGRVEFGVEGGDTVKVYYDLVLTLAGVSSKRAYGYITIRGAGVQ